MNPDFYAPGEHNIDPNEVSKHAVSIIKTLKENNFTAYIVGGGVRDLLLGLHPKDFDIATNAHPEQIADLFKNCRLIGRRFRLAHIYFRRHFIEVATYRASLEKVDEDHKKHSDEGIILKDNIYGTIEEDAFRRDFTCNALFYDPIENTIIDYTNGMRDIQNKVIHLIGDPKIRYQEDPVRILRAIRFACKLGFDIEESTYKAIDAITPLLVNIPSARLFEEYLKLFLSGHAQKIFKYLNKTGVLPFLFPLTAKKLSTPDFKSFVQQALLNTDNRIAIKKSINPGFLLAVFLWQPTLDEQAELIKRKKLHPAAALYQASEIVLKNQAGHIQITKRFANFMRDIWFIQLRLERRRANQIYRILKNPSFRAAYDFLVLRSKINPELQEAAKWWTDIQEVSPKECNKMITALKPPKKKKLKDA